MGEKTDAAEKDTGDDKKYMLNQEMTCHRSPMYQKRCDQHSRKVIMDEEKEKILRFFRKKLVRDLGKSRSSGVKGKDRLKISSKELQERNSRHRL